MRKSIKSMYHNRHVSVSLRVPVPVGLGLAAAAVLLFLAACTQTSAQINRKCSEEADRLGLSGPERWDFRARCKGPQPVGPPELFKPTPALGPATQTTTWTQLSRDVRPPQLRNKLSAEELFAKVRSSVWVVVATQSVSQSDAASRISQGSAIAITHSRLLTNYHVVQDQRFVFIKQGDSVFKATVVSGDKDSDRCVLAVKGKLLSPVGGLRGFEDLRVGEQVYTIGSPRALESTLGQGIVSGLRSVAGRQFVQTTAPISPGSSGGGLFDSAGNLVGITSFKWKNSEGLNFAIAAEDYFR